MDPETARDSHDRPLSTTPAAARLYRDAQQHHRDRPRLLTALGEAVTTDPDFAVAASDLAALGVDGPRPEAAPRHCWERHHIEVVLLAARGETRRAADLLRDHVSDVGCDPIATTVVVDRGGPIDDLGECDRCRTLPPVRTGGRRRRQPRV